MGASALEIAKYKRCYQCDDYRMGPARFERSRRDVQSIPLGSRYLDVGCGRGEMVDLANSRGVFAEGIDLVPDLARAGVGTGSVTALPFPDRSFEYVSCYDMIEHLPPEEVDRALDELVRVCGGTLFLSTNDKPSWYDGMELHLTRKPKRWWLEQLQKRAKSVEVDEYAQGEWHFTVTV